MIHCRFIFVPVFFFIWIFGCPLIANAKAPCFSACQSLRCILTQARCHLMNEQFSEAKSLLKTASTEYPSDVSLHLLLAKAYLKLGNNVWAKRVLYQITEKNPQSCQIRSWLIKIHLDGAELDRAETLLNDPGCPDTEPMKGRFHLLRAIFERYKNNKQRFSDHVKNAYLVTELFEEDEPLLGHLSKEALPSRIVPIQLRFELGAGYTTNGLMSTPVDVASLGNDAKTGSPILSLDFLGRFNPLWGQRYLGETIHPIFELGLKSLILPSSAKVSSLSPIKPFDYSFFNIQIRPGIAFGTLSLFYGGQFFLLTGSDKFGEGPRFFYETHRGELEWEPRSWLTFWGGAGKSFFREDIRTRIELDGGGGLTGTLWRLRLLGGLSLRRHFASEHFLQDLNQWVHAYSLWGGSLITSATFPSRYFSLRGRFVFSFDIYPESSGYFKDIQGWVVSENRRDLLIKTGAEIWSFSFYGCRVGLTYEFSRRVSTANSYGYMDHRTLFRLNFNLELDPWAPKTSKLGKESGHVSYPYTFSQSDHLEDERIQDLLRQEDAGKRGSSCLN